MASHRRRPQGRRSAPSARSPSLFGLAIVGSILFVVSYIVFKVGDDPDTIGNLGACNVALGVCLALVLLAMGAGMIQWARKLMGDHEIVEMRHPAVVLAGGPRGRRRRSCRRVSRSPGSAAVP